jgi:hypothetical protein
VKLTLWIRWIKLYVELEKSRKSIRSFSRERLKAIKVWRRPSRRYKKQKRPYRIPKRP